LAAASLGTAVWLAAELFTISTGRSSTWPFSALTMFSQPRSQASVVSLQGVTRSGERRMLRHEDFGLEAGNPLDVFVWRRIVRVDDGRPGTRPGAVDRARQLLGLYNDRHDGDPLTGLSVDVRVTSIPLDSASGETTTHLVSVRP